MQSMVIVHPKILLLYSGHFLVDLPASVSGMYDLNSCSAREYYIVEVSLHMLVLYTLQPNKPVQDKLFSRISDNYANLLVERVDDRWKDRFLKVPGSNVCQHAYNLSVLKLCLKHIISFCRQVYPDVIAQSVYSTFVYAFPASWNSFDDAFKTELYRIVSLWLAGEEYNFIIAKKKKHPMQLPIIYLLMFLQGPTQFQTYGRSGTSMRWSHQIF